ncbi:MAG: maleylpyruvate isomerase family mycothiol-dependent enzyme [Actinomycetota bacterium]
MTDIEGLSDAGRVDLLEQAFSSVEEVCAHLEPGDWDLQSDCPGWTVKDNLSHLTSYEAIMTGTEPASPVDLSNVSRITSEFQELNEREVVARRSIAGPDVLAEFRDATAKRLADLRALDEAAWDGEVEAPPGRLNQRLYLAMRILDVFYHEQDIRRATGRPGHLDGAVANFVFERLATKSLPVVVSRRGQAPDGSVVVFEVPAPGRTIAIQTSDSRGTLLSSGVPADSVLRFRMSVEGFFCVLGGRWTPVQARAHGGLEIHGDEVLARRILEHIVVVP